MPMRCLRWLCVALCATGAVLAVGLRADDRPLSEESSRGEPSPSAVAEPLAATQDLISRRYKRFEDTLYKIAESMRRTDPDRADLLIRAIGKSKEDRIGQQMSELVQLLRDNKQLGDAIDRQGDVVDQLHALLDLLLSEDRAKELKEEQARIKKYLEELNKIIAREKGNRADNERESPADEVAQQQQKIADQTGKLSKSIDKDDQAKRAKSRPAEKSGKPDDKQKEDPSDSAAPESGDSPSQEGPEKSGKGRPAPGKNQPPKDQGDGQEGPKTPSQGEPSESETPPGDAPPEGQSDPGDAAPAESPEGESQPGEPSPGESGQEAPQPGESGDKKPQEQTPGRDDLERAQRAMQQALEKLKKAQRHEASDAQDEALSNLQKAKEKLEEILRQLREEEKERFLAMLEARFQRMLTMQLLVYDGTQKLAKTPDDERSGRHSARAQALARQEDVIAIEATKAITLLRDEGSAVAFPEAVEQVRDDMRIVESRLERTEVGELTQSIEREIIDALEEMIEALQKEMEKSKDKKDQQKPQDGPPQDPQLVDQLAEFKMLRTLQLRVNHRTKRLGRLVEGEQANDLDLIGQLQNLAERQARIQKATHDIATGKNK
ncbi:MAG: hypothetical protein ACKV0T_26670 [Planctomycetales bacterium]